jgi:hypothetical protein
MFVKIMDSKEEIHHSLTSLYCDENDLQRNMHDELKQNQIANLDVEKKFPISTTDARYPFVSLTPGQNSRRRLRSLKEVGDK